MESDVLFGALLRTTRRLLSDYGCLDVYSMLFRERFYYRGELLLNTCLRTGALMITKVAIAYFHNTVELDDETLH